MYRWTRKPWDVLRVWCCVMDRVMIWLRCSQHINRIQVRSHILSTSKTHSTHFLHASYYPTHVIHTTYQYTQLTLHCLSIHCQECQATMKALLLPRALLLTRAMTTYPSTPQCHTSRFPLAVKVMVVYSPTPCRHISVLPRKRISVCGPLISIQYNTLYHMVFTLSSHHILHCEHIVCLFQV